MRNIGSLAVLMALASFALQSSCASHSTSIHPIENGVLRLNERQSLFEKYWGLPDRQYVVSSEEMLLLGGLLA